MTVAVRSPKGGIISGQNAGTNKTSKRVIDRNQREITNTDTPELETHIRSDQFV